MAHSTNEAMRPLESSKERNSLAAAKDLFVLTKPTISLLVVFTALPAMVLAANGPISLSLVLVTTLGTFLASCSAAVFNHLVDSDIDSGMSRTRSRPIPSGRVGFASAAIFGVALGLTSFSLLFYFANPLAAGISIAANFFYVVIYTMFLKRRTAQNIVIGGAAGAVGPLIGWAAVSADLSISAWLQFGLIFLWTPPHFWALALKYRKDYENAGVPMYPVVYGEERTRTQILRYSWALLPVIAALAWIEASGLIFFIGGFGLTVYFVHLAQKLNRTKDISSAMKLFHYSCVYLFGVFGLLALDHLLLG